MTAGATKQKAGALTMLLMLFAGSAGSLGAVAVFGKGTVHIAPLTMEVAVKPAVVGKTKLALDPGATGLLPGTADAKTHSSPLEFSARVTGITTQGIDLTSPLAPDKVTRNPRELDGFIREHGRSELRAFGIRVGLVSALGGLIGGLIVGLGNWKRTLATMVLGVAVVGGLGALAGSTYDVNQFQNVQWTPSAGP